MIDSAPLVWFTVRWWSARQMSLGPTQQGTPVRFRDGPAAVTRRIRRTLLQPLPLDWSLKRPVRTQVRLIPDWISRGEKARSVEPGSQKTYQGARRAVRSCEGRADCDMNRFSDCCAVHLRACASAYQHVSRQSVCASERMRGAASSRAIRIRDRCLDRPARPRIVDGMPWPLA